MAFLNALQLQALGFKKIGINVLISEKASFHGCSNIEIGHNTRIDDFCVLSAGVGGVSIGNNVHVAVYSSLIGAGKIVLGDFSNISSKVAIYSSNDDYSGEFMTNPTVHPEYTNVTSRSVNIGRHVIVGSGSVVLPGVNLHDGCAVGALSLISKDCAAGYIYAGNPANKIKKRSNKIFELENQFKEDNKGQI
jgi:acetyltransferase-like isoleucine patch superfamily enzyme